MKLKAFFTSSLSLALFTVAAHAEAPNQAKLDQFFDRLAEKNQAMGSLAIVKDGKVLYTRAIGYGQINGAEKKPLTAANATPRTTALFLTNPATLRVSRSLATPTMMSGKRKMPA